VCAPLRRRNRRDAGEASIARRARSSEVWPLRGDSFSGAAQDCARRPTPARPLASLASGVAGRAAAAASATITHPTSDSGGQCGEFAVYFDPNSPHFPARSEVGGLSVGGRGSRGRRSAAQRSAARDASDVRGPVEDSRIGQIVDGAIARLYYVR
jgi:hypothetical protein